MTTNSKPINAFGVQNILLLSILLALLCAISLPSCGTHKDAEKRTVGLNTFEGERPENVPEDIWKLAPTTAGHKTHSFDLTLSCDTCHGEDDTFTLTPTFDACVSCHTDTKFQSEPLSKFHCIACHPFKVQPSGYQLIPKKEDCQTCHSAESQAVINRDFFDNPAKTVACQSCHQPHEESQVIDTPTCLSCHAVYKPTDLKNPGHQSCMQCHRPHEWRNEFTQEFCTQCHTQTNNVMEHLFPFHPKECSSCHTPHLQLNAQTSQCMDCHKGSNWNYAPAGIPAKHAECVTCHSQTDWSFKGINNCASCHAQKIYGQSAIPASVPRGHQQCLTCHPPHNWNKPAVPASCASCHPAVAKQTIVAKKHDCTMCHTPHNPTFKGWQSCATCHHTAVENSTGIQYKENCALCHNPHTWKIDLPKPNNADLARVLDVSIEEIEKLKEDKVKFEFTKEQLQVMHTIQKSNFCASCHSDQQELGNATSAQIKADCALCHNDHTWRPEADLCLSCHNPVKIESAGTGMESCAYCHSSHQWNPPVPQTCETCHPAPVAAGREAGSSFKTNCANCHAPHTWTARLDCMSCHGDVAEQLSSGPHTSCSFCHADHSWTINAKTSCATCHSEIVGMSSNATKQNCAMCHSAHEFSASDTPSCATCHSDAKPANSASIKNNCAMCHPTHEWKASFDSCASCHSDMTSKGLHREAMHQSCSTCHSGHTWREVPRSTCNMCHSDKADDHYPAQSCSSCHWFK